MAQTRIAFISRMGQAMIPGHGTVLQEGDVLHVIAEEGRPGAHRRACSAVRSRGRGAL